jgi:hypothetical protein
LIDIMTFSREWHALSREAELCAELLAAGTTALGDAHHAGQGLYTQAFFGLAGGLERLAKLIIIVDHAAAHAGAFPNNKTLRSYGHELSTLMDACETIIAKSARDPMATTRPRNPIHTGITGTLDEFARLTRYYNLDMLSGGSAPKLPEPIAAWWSRVAEPILERHYTKAMRRRDEADAAMLEAMFGDRATVVHHSEAEEIIDSVTKLHLRAGATRVVQRYGRVYTLQIVRWLVEGLCDLLRALPNGKASEAFMGLNEPFVLFRNDDQYFRGRKTWSIYRP